MEESRPEVVTFSPDERYEYIVVPVLDDTIFEGMEEFNGTLVTTDTAVRITQPNATVRITENDSKSQCVFPEFDDVIVNCVAVVRVYFENDSYVVDEEDGVVTVCVVREGEISDTLTIQISTAELVPPQATGEHIFTAQVSLVIAQHFLHRWYRLSTNKWTPHSV